MLFLNTVNSDGGKLATTRDESPHLTNALSLLSHVELENSHRRGFARAGKYANNNV